MDREVIIDKLAFYFELEPEENGEFDLDSYDWQAGCSMGGGLWLNLANVVEALADD